MKKRFLNFSLIGALLLGSAVSFVGCKDYDDDIDNLQEQIDKLKSSLEEIKASIKDGVVVTDVDSSDNGIVITLSNGKTYPITNGKDGAAGEAGAVWKIVTVDGVDYWQLPGVHEGTDYPTRGEKGEKGDQGLEGPQGPQGPQGPAGSDGGNGTGTNGKYYYPNANGNWYVVEDEENNPEGVDTGKAWAVAAEGAITAAYDKVNGTITFHGVEGLEDGYVLYTTAKLRSLVFVPQCYYGGIQAIDFSVFNYQNVNETTGVETGVKSTIFPRVTATYHVNPSTVTESKLLLEEGDLAFAYESRLDYYTKADVTPKPVYVANSLQDGKMTVEITNISQIDFTTDKNKVDVLALQVKNADDESVVTSDYAAVYKGNKFIVAIAQPKNKGSYTGATGYDHRHYRKYLTDITSRADLPNNELYIDENTTLQVEDTEGLDLRSLVETHYSTIGFDAAHNDTQCLTMDAATMKEYGFDYKFELVDFNRDQDGTGAKTNQRNYAVIENDKLIAYFDKQYNSPVSIGKTPLIKVSLTHNGTVVKVAYIVAEIVDTEFTPLEYKLANYNLGAVRQGDRTTSTFYTELCSGTTGTTIRTTVDQMTQLYKKLQVSNSEFHLLYDYQDPEVELINPNPATLTNRALFENVTVIDNAGGPNTHVLQWTFNNRDLWDSNVDDYQVKVTYKSSSDRKDATVILNLHVDRPANPTLGEKFKSVWEENVTVGRLNLEIPELTEVYNGPTKERFISELNALFVSNRPMSYSASDVVLNDFIVDFKFRDDQPTGPNGARLTVTNNGRTLWADGYRIAQITPTVKEGELYYNRVEYFRDNDVAKNLLSTNLLKANVEAYAKSESCEERKTVTIDNGKFTVRFIRPLNAENTTGVTFYDGKIGGNEVDLYKFVKLSDWNGNPVRIDKGSAQGGAYDGYLWKYYGVQYPYEVKLNEATCSSTSTGKLPDFMRIGYDSTTGVLTYENSTAAVGSVYNVKIPVRVNFYWGYSEFDLTVTIEPSGN